MTAIPFQPQLELPIFYKGKKLKTRYRSDFVCYEDIIVELKALARLGDGELAQVLNYLKASRQQRALLINFGLHEPCIVRRVQEFGIMSGLYRHATREPI